MADLEQTVIVTPETVIVLSDPDLTTRRPRKVYSGMWGSPEIAAISIGTLFLLLAIVLYVFYVVPSTREVVKNRSEADRLGAELISANDKYGEITDSKDQARKLLVSVDDFETRFLPAATNGRTSLYQRLNGLIRGYGLTNTTGPDYQPLEIAEQDRTKNQNESERGRERFRSLFPGVYVTMTLEGSYQNLRRFIREIETGNEFVIVSSVELAPSDSEQKKTVDNSRPPAATQPGGAGFDPTGANPGFVQPSAPAQVARPKGKTQGEVVSLRLEMAAYFRRANYAPMVTGQ